MEKNERIYNLLDATTIGVGAIVGGGILALSGVAFKEAGPSALVAFLLNGGIAFLTAMSFAEMATAFPENGGAYRYAKKVFSVRAAFGVGWVLAFAFISAAGLYAIGFAAYFVEGMYRVFTQIGIHLPEWTRSGTTQTVWALLAVGGYTFYLTKNSGGTGRIETVGKLALFLLILLGGFWMLGGTSSDQVTRSLDPFFPFGGTGILAAMGFTFITFQGFDIIAAVGGQVQTPSRTLPRAMFLSLAITLLVYLPLLFLLAVLGTPGDVGIAEFAARNTELLVGAGVRQFLGEPGYYLVMVAAVLSMLSALFANLLAASRVARSMAEDRTLPRFLAAGKENNGPPVRSVLSVAMVGVVFILLTTDVQSAGGAASLIFLLSFGLVHLTAYLGRIRGLKGEETYRTPFFPLVPVLGMILCVSLAGFQAMADVTAGGVALSWLLIGYIVYRQFLSGSARVMDAQDEAKDPSIQRLRGKNPLVLVPVSHPEHSRSLIQVADALVPPGVGRVLLLKVISTNQTEPVELSSTRKLLGEALGESVQSSAWPRTLVTFSDDTPREIVTVAREKQCETILLGMQGIRELAESSTVPYILDRISCDIVLLAAPDGWSLADVDTVLIPVAGRRFHDELRARILTSLNRKGACKVRYLHVMPGHASFRQLREMKKELQARAREESDAPFDVDVKRSDEPESVLGEAAAKSELVVLGRRVGSGSPFLRRAGRATAENAGGATIVIQHSNNSS